MNESYNKKIWDEKLLQMHNLKKFKALVQAVPRSSSVYLVFNALTTYVVYE